MIDDDYKTLNKLQVAVHWYCKACNISVQKVMGSVARLQNRMEKVEARLQELKNELSIKIQEVCVQVTNSIRKDVEGQKLEMEKVQKDLVKVIQEVGNAVSRTEVDQVLQKEVTGRINKFTDKIDDSVKEIRGKIRIAILWCLYWT